MSTVARIGSDLDLSDNETSTYVSSGSEKTNSRVVEWRTKNSRKNEEESQEEEDDQNETRSLYSISSEIPFFYDEKEKTVDTPIASVPIPQNNVLEPKKIPNRVNSEPILPTVNLTSLIPKSFDDTTKPQTLLNSAN